MLTLIYAKGQLCWVSQITHYAEFRYAECLYAESRYTECRGD